MSQEHSRTNDTQFGGVYKEYLKIDREPVLRREERFLKDSEMGVVVGLNS